MKPYLLLSTLAALSMTASCASLTASGRPINIPATDGRPVACIAFAPIIYSRKHDTAETIAAVKEHNAAFDALCRR